MFVSPFRFRGFSGLRLLVLGMLSIGLSLGLFFANGVRPAYAVEPGEILKDAGLERRARVISAELRCLVCQNQSIDDSNAPLAHDLRILVRERLVAGDSNDQVFDYVVARYGTYVLLKPPLNVNTLLLWLAPLLILLGASFVLYRGYQSRSRGYSDVVAGGDALSDEERAQLDELLGAQSDDDPGGERGESRKRGEGGKSDQS